ncbi:LacI family DNA-binding transcriptional regulator [Nitratireductor luteus]|uniref:LacI family DNA-binding transcriptional regulator n=1 Tax=Nitratireductor luteus TaxID=2976980 RepID=UPI00223ED9CC|nr:LacI family DNA-binding transcriptional regulator [Nitratireductor luteus]
MTTQREIARRAKTSLKTVSRVINRDPLVNAKTRARIEAIVAELRYEPSQAARMMRSQRSNIIGFLADQVATSASSIDLVRGAQDAAWECGKQMMLFNIVRGTPSQDLADAQLAAFRAEAVIYAAVYHQPVELPPSAVPRVLLNCFDPGGGQHAIVPDDYQLAATLMDEVLDRGYRRPAFLNLNRAIVAAGLRAAGITDAAHKRGLDMTGRIHEVVVGPEHHGQPQFIADKIVPELMSAPSESRPDVLICAQDILAMDVYFVLSELRLKVSQHVAVASFDNREPIASLLKPGLSTMELPYYEMGRAAMLAAINPPPAPETVRLPGRFIERGSLQPFHTLAIHRTGSTPNA